MSKLMRVVSRGGVVEFEISGEPVANSTAVATIARSSTAAGIYKGCQAKCAMSDTRVRFTSNSFNPDSVSHLAFAWTTRRQLAQRTASPAPRSQPGANVWSESR
jgi:hypothetical protein